MKLHIGDSVVIISGKDKGKQGTVLRVLPTQNRIVVEGANMRTRHIKKTTQGPGQRITYEASLHASNVMILDPKSKKPTRIGYKVDPKTGKKSRFAKMSGEILALAAKTKAAKPAKKSTAKSDATEKEEKKTTAKPDTAPNKQPFWKRGAKTEAGQSGGGASGADEGPNVIQTAHRSQGG
jgi:large subunit ribosomal protein L24